MLHNYTTTTTMMIGLSFILVAGSVTSAVGFTLPSGQLSSTSTRLHDSLFDDLYEDNSSGSNDKSSSTLPPKNYNDDAEPFSSSESPQDRYAFDDIILCICHVCGVSSS